MAQPTIYPTGTTVYEPDKCWNGFNLLAIDGLGIMLVDMNGNEIHFWKGVNGFPAKMLKNGDIMAQLQMRPGKFASKEYKDLSQIDWDGNVVWQWNKLEYIEDPDETPGWQARMKSDFQREGNPCGYYSPELDCKTDSGKTLLVCHRNVTKKAISPYPLIDDGMIEVDYEGNILWQWWAADHIEEMGFSPDARMAMFYNPNMRMTGRKGEGDWAHVNNANYLGPNKWYDAGDERFHPDNIIWDSRECNIIAITSRKTGEIMWQTGPDYNKPEFEKLGWIIGQHHAHMIPKGLPGAGNILVFDNGGSAGYGSTHATARYGEENVKRDYSRVVEFNPVTLEIVWQYTPASAGFMIPTMADGFYSSFVSSAQRLPNGNTLITQGAYGIMTEVTPQFETVWEYVNPYTADPGTNVDGGVPELFEALAAAGFVPSKFSRGNYMYRAYRVPYEYCPRAAKPQEIAIPPINLLDFRMPGAAPRKNGEGVTVTVHNAESVYDDSNFCIKSKDEEKAVKNFLQQKDR